jgi:hypothetical protein
VGVIKSWRSESFNPKIFVIALGSNNIGKDGPSSWVTIVNKALTEIGPGHEVHWIGIGFRDETYDVVGTEVVSGLAKVLKDCAKEKPELTFEDWNAYIRTQPQDGIWAKKNSAPAPAPGIHMTFPGYDIRNAWVASRLPVVPKPPTPTTPALAGLGAIAATGYPEPGSDEPEN